MPQAAKSDQFLYADDSWLVFQRKHVIDIEKHINRDSTNICEWFVDIRVSIHFGEDNTRFNFLFQNVKLRRLSITSITSITRLYKSNNVQKSHA